VTAVISPGASASDGEQAMSDLRSGVDQYLHRCFATEETPRVSELASQLGTTAVRLSRDFTAVCGLSLSSYLKRRQIRQAQRLLTESTLTTTRIGYASGFGTRRTFYRAFRRGTGLSPDQYRRLHACAK
jgi:AraC-like DNA-binding protein